MHEVDVYIPPEHPAFPGHFPGQPLLPGVAVLSEVLEAALTSPELAARIGAAPRLGVAKFLSPVRPGATLSIRFDPAPGPLRFEVRAADRLVASGHFEAVV